MIGCKSFNALSYNKEDLRNEFFFVIQNLYPKKKEN